MESYDSITITNRQPSTFNVPWGYYQGLQTVVPNDPVVAERSRNDNNNIATYKVPPEKEVSWKLVREQRLIKMTPYRVGKIETSPEFIAKFPHRIWSSNRHSNWEGSISNPTRSYDSGIMTGSIDYTENVTLNNLGYSQMFRDAPHYSLNDVRLQEHLDKVINEVKAKVISDSYSNYDLLTEIAEGKETLEMLASFLKLAIHPINGIRDLIEKQKKVDRMNRRTPAARRRAAQANEEVSNQWMQYRYGIMPLVYSIQDILELLDKKDKEFKTSRSFQIINLNSFVDKPTFGLPDAYLIDVYSGSIRVNGTAKARFDGLNLRLLDQITINPFLTAWELIPMSFVIDWFVNVGDVLFSKTSTLIDLAVERQFCIAVKKDYTRYINVCASYTEVHNFSSKSTFHGDLSISKEFSHESEQPLRKDKHDEYERFLFTPDSVKLQLFPSMNWMRWLDAYSLSLKPILKALKKL